MKIVILLIFFIIQSVILMMVPNDIFAENIIKRKALLIANYNYHKKSWRLTTPRNDIQALQKILQKSGFQVTVHYNLQDKRALEDAFANFGKTLDKNTIAFIHYAGHGIELSKQSLILGTRSSVRTETVAKQEGLPTEVLIEIVNLSKEGIVSIDACRNNPFYSSRRSISSQRGIHLGKNMREPEGIDGVMLIYSTAEGQTAEDGERLSPFIASVKKAYASHANSPIAYFFGTHVQDELRNLSVGSQKIEIRNFGSMPSFTLIKKKKEAKIVSPTISNQKKKTSFYVNGSFGRSRTALPLNQIVKLILESETNLQIWNERLNRWVQWSKIEVVENQVYQKRLEIKDHKRLVAADWAKCQSQIRRDKNIGITTINLFLRKYEKHPLGNHLQRVAQQRLSKLQSQKVKISTYTSKKRRSNHSSVNYAKKALQNSNALAVNYQTDNKSIWKAIPLWGYVALLAGVVFHITNYTLFTQGNTSLIDSTFYGTIASYTVGGIGVLWGVKTYMSNRSHQTLRSSLQLIPSAPSFQRRAYSVPLVNFKF